MFTLRITTLHQTKLGHRGDKGLAQELTASEWLSQSLKPGPEAHMLAMKPWAGVISAARVCIPMPQEQSPFDYPLAPPGQAGFHQASCLSPVRGKGV